MQGSIKTSRAATTGKQANARGSASSKRNPLTFCHLHRRMDLERRLQDPNLSDQEREALKQELERKETDYARLQRHKMSVDDFELLSIIGRGAFGEVCRLPLCRLHSPVRA